MNVVPAAADTAPAGDVLQSVFDEFPHGLLVVNAAGIVEAANPAVREMLGVVGEPVAGRTCCSLLGCGSPHDAGGRGCVTTRVLGLGDVIRDVAVELPLGRGTAQMSAAGLGRGPERLVVELRAPAPIPWSGGSIPVRIRSLGRTAVEIRGVTSDGGWLDQRPGQLLKYLVAERGRVASVDDIAEALWPSAEFTSVNTVRHLVHVLRGHLEPRRPGVRGSGGIVSRPGGYALDPDVVAIDADEFVGAAGVALAAFAGDDPTASAQLAAALAIYGGDFLADEPYARWAQVERERLRAIIDRVLRALADLALARGDLGAASAYVERLADLEPFDGDVQRQLIALAVREGRRGRALRLYHAYALRLHRSFGEEPDFLLEEVVQGPRALLRLSDGDRWRREQEVRGSFG